MRPSAWLLTVTLGSALVACHRAPPPSVLDGGGDQGVGDGGLVSGDLSEVFDVEPSTLQTITVTAGQMSPTVTYTATLNGVPVSVAWVIDRADIATAGAGPSATATVTPTGTTGGLLTVMAGFNGQTIKRQVFVQVTKTQNGYDSTNADEVSQVATSTSQLTAGGGIGGVGGEGLGPAADPTAVTALGSPMDGASQNLALLYPYDSTVFPRGMLAPLLMWSWTPGDADAIKIELATTSGSFSWSGTFGRPAILTQTGGKYVRCPIPQDVWKMATDSAGGPTPSGGTDQLTMKLTVEKGGTAYGPLTETWRVAAARLSGIIYYQSYGTNLVQDSDATAIGGGHFGGAILSIHVGDTAPKLAAGKSGTDADCRVCHSVSADGSRLLAQQGTDGYPTTSEYAIDPMGLTEKAMTNDARFAGLTPDGQIALTEDTKLLQVANDATPIATSVLSSVTTSIGPPAFSPSGTAVVFNPQNGPITDPTHKLVAMSFDPASNAFSNPVTVVDFGMSAPVDSRAGWPSFLPDSKSIVYQHQLTVGDDGESAELWTRKGPTAQIEWTSASDASHVTVLNALNGADASGTPYIPKLAAAISMSCKGDNKEEGGKNADHSDDIHMNYEPTVNPIASGGYAWIVFTSRRMYGNEATIPPFCSDPRGVDLTTNITPKKLWVAAIDLNAPPGTDASHPAFYLPAQELLAGNSRAFWVLDPCRSDGAQCDTGDQCCGGYCEPNGSGQNVCANNIPMSSCAMEQEKCNTATDCCNAADTCTNGFCTVGTPPIL